MKLEERNKKKEYAVQPDVSAAMGFHIIMGADISVGSLPFRLLCQSGGEDSALRAEWNSGGGKEGEEPKKLELKELSGAFADSPVSFGVPDAIGQFDLRLTKVALTYFFKRSAFRFLMEALPYGSFRVEAEKKGTGTVLAFILVLNAKFYFDELPALGGSANQKDYIGLKKFMVRLNPDGTLGIEALLEMELLKEVMELPIAMKFPVKKEISGPGLTPAMTENPVSAVFPETERVPAAHDFSRTDMSGLAGDEPAIHWIDVGKDAGPLHLSRLGFTMDESSAAVYVDAGIKLSVLMLEFMGLNLSLPFQAGKSVGYGLSGLAVSVSKPPLSISGGLYLAGNKSERIYTGEVMVRYQDFGLTALCSYGEMAGGKPSLFAFLILETPVGGPPAFCVTGIAGGFGYNRTIRLPARVQDAGAFPFVAAAMGTGKLKPSMTPAEALTAMNEYIKPQNNQYFLSAGIRFTSFGIVESFALLNLEFGERFVLSLLGISKLTLPTGASSPMAYVELAIKAVFAPDDGLLSVEGALSTASYLLDKSCRLQGGFAFFLWFGEHEHAGDFVISLGGYRSGFLIKHYPSVDRIGVNWNMGGGLTLAAEFYFALIPSGVMMGGNLGLTYEWKRLKAWLRVWAEFFMQWKPFYYEISVGVSVGASYRWDFFPFYKTFTVELGASLNLWGPPFGGKARISWFVISFTINFGKGRPSQPLVDWDDFVATFLKETGDKKTAVCQKNSGEKRLIAIQAADGILRESENKTGLLMDSDHMKFKITSRMMCTKVCFGDKLLAETHGLGILPMGLSSFESVLTVRLAPDGSREKEASVLLAETESVLAGPIGQNVPKAVWAVRKPSANDTETLMNQVPDGLILSCKEKDPEGVLPSGGTGFYDMEILCRNERLKEHDFTFTNPDPVEPKVYPEENRLRQIEDSIGKTGGERKQILDELSGFFGIFREDEIRVSGWTSSLDEILYAEPVLCRIGAEDRKREGFG